MCVCMSLSLYLSVEVSVFPSVDLCVLYLLVFQKAPRLGGATIKPTTKLSLACIYNTLHRRRDETGERNDEF